MADQEAGRLDLSLIVPCYNEASHIDQSLPELVKVMSTSNLAYEIVLIDDSSSDDTRERLVRLAVMDARVRVEYNQRNLGRGGTVTRGFRESTATVVGFLDIDLSTQPVYAPYLTRLLLDDEADVATCRRTYKIELRVLHRTWHRILLSHGYRTFCRLMFRHGLKDTETGFKFFRREKLLPVLDRITDQHWFWDTEVMVLSHLFGYRIIEVDSLFVRRPAKPSTVKIIRDVAGYLRNAFRFRRALQEGRVDLPIKPGHG